MNSDCIFCRIIAGELPASKVYEDEQSLAFLDISPVVKGHTLVIPRQHYGRMEDAPSAVLEHLIRTVRIVLRAQREGLGAEAMNVTQANGEVAGQVVPHLHFHVIPRFAADGLTPQWKQGAYRDQEEMTGIASKIRDAAGGGA